MSEFGRRLRELRLLRNMSLRDLEDKSGMSYSFIGSLEKGRFNASRDTVLRLATALDANANELLLLAGFAVQETPQELERMDEELQKSLSYAEEIWNDKLLSSEIPLFLKEYGEQLNMQLSSPREALSVLISRLTFEEKLDIVINLRKPQTRPSDRTKVEIFFYNLLMMAFTKCRIDELEKLRATFTTVFQRRSDIDDKSSTTQNNVYTYSEVIDVAYDIGGWSTATEMMEFASWAMANINAQDTFFHDYMPRDKALHQLVKDQKILWEMERKGQ